MNAIDIANGYVSGRYVSRPNAHGLPAILLRISILAAEHRRATDTITVVRRIDEIEQQQEKKVNLSPMEPRVQAENHQ